MTFPILGGNGAVTGFSIDNSLRLNQSDNPRLTRTPSSQGNPRTFTFSCWAKKSSNGTRQVLFGADIPSQANASYVRFTDDDTLQAYFDYGNNTLEANLNSVAKFRDVSAFYHIVWATDTSLSTEADRIKLYVNGVQITDFQSPDYISQNFGTDINQTHPHYVGTDTVGVGNDSSLGGYLADVHFIDGQQLSPTDFGEFDEDSGIWKPKEYDGSYGTNGFKLDFSNSSNFGEDFSGNDNDFTATNLASTDQTTDTPTNNFATINALANQFQPATLSEGNTRVDFDNGTNTKYNISTIGVSSGKWYCEVKAVTIPDYAEIGIASRPCAVADDDKLTRAQYNYGYASENGNVKSNNGSGASYGDTYDDGDIIGIILDLDNNKIYFSKNGTVQNSGDPTSGATGTGAISIQAPSGTPDGVYYFAGGDNRNNFDTRMDFNFGNPAFSISSGNNDDNGYGNFEYAPPSGYLALCTQNLATALSPTIDDGSQYFNTLTWSGDNTTRSFTGLGFSPDWVWIKNRNNSGGQVIYDSVRGNGKQLQTHSTDAELTNPQFGYVSSFDSDGFTTTPGTYSGYESGNVNMSGRTYVGWNWRGSDSNAVSNTDGSITSTVSANTTSGFSIVTYTGTGSNATVGHGLSKAPEIIIVKNRDYSPSDWQTGSDYLTSWAYRLKLNGTNAEASVTSSFNSTAPTSTVINIGNNDDVNRSGNSHLIYAFHSVEGYSKIGKYTGNGSTDGTFVYTGFRPSFIITKKTDGTSNWGMLDATRSPFNVADDWMGANLSNAESVETTRDADLLSNGFKARGTNEDINNNGSSYIYMAFAENPFVDSNGVPVTAR